MSFPDFIGIGAQKAGTSWLAEMLRHHPEVWVPPLKELHYFNDLQFENRGGLEALYDPKAPLRHLRFHRIRELMEKPEVFDSPDVAKWYLKWLFGDRTDEWYSSLFDFPHKAKVVGEITPEYALIKSEAIKKIYGSSNKLKIIFSLRNPIYRTWSHASMRFRLMEGRTIEDVVEDEIVNFFHSANARNRNQFVGTYKRWVSFFPDKQIFISFLEEISGDPEALLKRLAAFLEISDFPKGAGAHIEKAVGKGSYTNFPEKYKKLLAKLYYKDISEAADYFGAH